MLTKKSAPYGNSSVDPYKTQGQIDKLLSNYGISKRQWNLDTDHNLIQLIMEVETKDEKTGQDKKLVIKITPPLFLAKRRTWDKVKGRYVVVTEPNLSQSMRLLFHWTKAKMEAVAYGLSEIEQEFLAQIVINTKQGIMTVGEALGPSIASGMLALESGRDEGQDTVIVDSEYKRD